MFTTLKMDRFRLTNWGFVQFWSIIIQNVSDQASCKKFNRIYRHFGNVSFILECIWLVDSDIWTLKKPVRPLFHVPFSYFSPCLTGYKKLIRPFSLAAFFTLGCNQLLFHKNNCIFVIYCLYFNWGCAEKAKNHHMFSSALMPTWFHYLKRSYLRNE